MAPTRAKPYSTPFRLRIAILSVCVFVDNRVEKYIILLTK